MAVKPTTWVYPVRNRLARQILFAGVEAIPISILVALLAGATVYLQCLLTIELTGKADLLSQMVVTVLFREAAPFLATFIVIGASASAITTELANMKASGEVALLEAQGINLFHYLAVPRMIGLAICVAGLSIIIVSFAMISSVMGFLIFSTNAYGAAPFLISILEAVDAADWVSLLVRSLLPGLIMGTICCYEGLRVKGIATEVPQAVSRAILQSIGYSVLIWGVVIMITYLS